jgi:hypothetical protein
MGARIRRRDVSREPYGEDAGTPCAEAAPESLGRGETRHGYRLITGLVALLRRQETLSLDIDLRIGRAMRLRIASFRSRRETPQREESRFT